MAEDPLRIARLIPRNLFHLFVDDMQALRWNLKGMKSRGTRDRYSGGYLIAMGIVQLYCGVVLLAALGFLGLAIARRARAPDVSWPGDGTTSRT